MEGKKMDKAQELFEIAMVDLQTRNKPIEIHGVNGTAEYEHSAYSVNDDGSRSSLWWYYTPGSMLFSAIDGRYDGHSW